MLKVDLQLAYCSPCPSLLIAQIQFCPVGPWQELSQEPFVPCVDHLQTYMHYEVLVIYEEIYGMSSRLESVWITCIVKLISAYMILKLLLLLGEGVAGGELCAPKQFDW